MPLVRLLPWIPALGGLVLLAIFGCDMLWGQDWELVPLLAKWDVRTLAPADLLRGDAGHRPVFPRVIQLSGLIFGGGSATPLLAVGFVLRLVLFLLAWRLLERTRAVVRPFSGGSWWLGPAVGILVFVPMPALGPLDASAIGPLLATVATLAGLGLLADGALQPASWALASALGLVAAASAGMGLLVLPLGLLLVARPCARRWLRTSLGAAISLLIVAATVDLATMPEWKASVSTMALGLGDLVAVVTPGTPSFGRSFAGGVAAVLLVGLAAGLMVWDARRARTARWFWLVVGGFAVLAAVLRSVAVGERGVATPEATLLWIALLGLLVTWPPPRVRRGGAGVVGAVALLVVVWGGVEGWRQLRVDAEGRREVRDAWVSGRIENVDPASLRHVSLEGVRTLDRLGMAPDRDGSAR